MSRYVGILYKFKKILPLSVRKNIYYGLVQSHLNYCSLVWGLGPKASIEPLFSEQKKSVRALMPGFNPNFYYKGKIPSHTKGFFTESNILTVQSIILTNMLLLMYKYHNLRQCIPQSVANIISPLAPYLDTSQYNDKKWLASHNTGKYRNSLCFKGPLFYNKYIADIQANYQNKNTLNIPILSPKCFKNYAKSFMLKIQGKGDSEIWEGHNTPLYNVPGLARNSRNTVQEVSYTHFYN